MSRRAAVLVLLLLISMAVILPLISSTARNRKSSASFYHARHRHSRAWWKRHRARLRRQRASGSRRRRELAAKLNHNITEPLINENGPTGGIGPVRSRALALAGGNFNDPRGVFSLTVPGGWNSRPAFVNGEYKFRVFASDGRPAGEATLSQVSAVGASSASSSGVPPFKLQRRMLAGVPLSELRRIVINRMIDAGGWVVNDLEREVGGRQVFVVFAQTAASSDGRTPPQTLAFYFTEMEGRIYNFATSSPVEFSDRLAADSEKVLASFRSLRRPALAETSRP